MRKKYWHELTQIEMERKLMALQRKLVAWIQEEGIGCGTGLGYDLYNTTMDALRLEWARVQRKIN